jgi:hypothetical protein
MKRSEFDRFIDATSGRAHDVSAEVYVTATDESRRPASIRRRYLPSALALIAVAGAISVTSLGSGGGRRRSCVDAGGYGGLGARVSAFDANNNDSTGPAGPSPGTAFYVLTAAAGGCVTGFAIEDSATPPLKAPGLVRPFLPVDAKQVLSTEGCAVWKSRALARATGRAYARASAIPGAGSIPATAEIAATSNSAC